MGTLGIRPRRPAGFCELGLLIVDFDLYLAPMCEDVETEKNPHQPKAHSVTHPGVV